MTRFAKAFVFLSLGLALGAGVCIAAEPSGEPIPLAMIVPLTGDFGEFGRAEVAAARLAVRQINDAGGLAGREVSVLVEDSESSPERGAGTFARMLEANHARFFYVASSGVALAVAPLAERAGVFLLTDAADPRVGEACSLAFRHCPDAGRETERIAEYAMNELKLRTLALFHVKGAYGDSYVVPFRRSVESRGGRVVARDFFEQDQTEFRPQLSRLLSSRPDGIYFIGFGPSLANAIRQARGLGFTGPIFAASSVAYRDTYAAAPEALEGTLYTDIMFTPGSGDARAQAFIEEYRRQSGGDPTPLVAMTYDAVTLMLEGIREVGDDPVRVRDWILKTKSRDGLSGRVTIEPDRRFRYDLAIWRVAGSKPAAVLGPR